MKICHILFGIVFFFAGPTFTIADDPVCPTGQKAIFLGDKSGELIEKSSSGRRQFIQGKWRTKIDPDVRKGKRNKVWLKPVKDIVTGTRGYLGWKYVEGSEPEGLLGIGVSATQGAQGLNGNDDPDIGLIKLNQGLQITLGSYIVSSMNVGVQLLNSGEEVRWVAYKGNDIVKEGTVQGVEDVNDDPEGKVNFEVKVDGGFTKILFTVAESAPDSGYLLEYIEGCYFENSAPGPGQKCNGPTGRISGDPHVVTFDKLKYDCQGRGEFVVVQDDEYNVQARFVVGGNDKRSVTVTKAIAFQFPDAPKIEVHVPDSTNATTCDYTFFVDGATRDVENLGIVSDAITAVFEEKKLFFHHPESNARISLTVKLSSVNGCVLSYTLCLPDDLEDVYGLLGTPNGLKEDDWTMPNGTVVEIPSSDRDRRFEKAYNYCTTWCIGQETDSLFTYVDGGKNFTEYNIDCLGDYDPTLEDAIDDVPETCEEICNGDLACLIDCAVGGEADAEDYEDTEDELDDAEDDPPGENVGGGEKPTIAGDPHITTWGGVTYDFHGECDLVLLENPYFNGGLGMDIHVRSKKMFQWSYISSAALRIGDDIFEVRGNKDDVNGNSFWINGFASDSADIGEAAKQEKQLLLQHTLSGYPISYAWVTKKQREFTIDLHRSQKIIFKIWNKFVRVDLVGAKASDFGRSLGLMGTYGKGIMVARDRTTILNDPEEFGMEWQVQVADGHLFRNPEGPQAPEKCRLPNTSAVRRRLRESILSQEEAHKACTHVDGSDRDLCIFDVMATNDLGIAGAY